MKTDLQVSHLSITPGHSGSVEIDVTNTADVIDGVTAIVDGINPDWVRLDRPVVSLFPEATDRVLLVFDIPRTCPAGDYLVVARIVSTIDDERQGVHDFWLTVESVPDLDLKLRPAIVTGGKAATITATVVNTGNAAAAVALHAEEPTRDIDCLVDPSSFHIPQDHEAIVDITLRGPRPWFGQPVPRTIHVTAETDGVVVEQLATFNQKPRIPRGVLTALMLAAIVALWALIFLWVIGEMRRTEDPAKVLATDFHTGQENIPLANIAGTLEGTVTAATTGAGIPRITVEAQRLTPEGFQTVGSAATDDDGFYALPSLIPGTYQLRYSADADSYPVVWYPGVPDESEAELIDLEPRQVPPLQNISLTGRSVDLTGQIDLPENAGDDGSVTLQVTAKQQVERADGQVSDDPSVAPAEVTTETTDGSILLEDLPTPATYTITVSGTGFETQQFDQTLAGGQETVLNTVNLAAASGSISGYVTDAANNRLGGVDVTLRSGDTELRSSTPTAGDIGSFSFVGLDTPRTYVLTFELSGYSSETISLDLDSGTSAENVSAQLTGGLGTVTGSAVDPDGAPLGGVPVYVLGDGVATGTTTLTTDGAGGAQGSFTVADLPTGEYAVTIGGADQLPETLRARFTEPGPQPLGTVTILPTGALLSGTVSGPAGGLGAVTVTLSDGVTPRVTTSATNPPGQFAFSNTLPGSYTLTFDATGFDRRVVIVQVEAGTDIDRAVTLVPES